MQSQTPTKVVEECGEVLHARKGTTRGLVCIAPPPFLVSRVVRELQYSSPSSVDEAVEILAESSQDPRVLAGGTDLLIQLRAGVRQARHLVDVKRVPEMNVLHADARAGLRMGAAVPAALLVEHPAAGELYPGLVEAAALIGSDQIQNRATLAGNLCNASPAADTTPALLALGAACTIAGPNGRRELPAAEVVTAPGRTALAPGELVVEIRIPPPTRGSADAYQRLTPRREMDIAVVGVGARVTVDESGSCTDAQVALGAVGPRAFVADAVGQSLVGTNLEEDALQRAGALASQAAEPISDKRGTAAYRRHVAGVLTRRVVAEAARRAKERL